MFTIEIILLVGDQRDNFKLSKAPPSSEPSPPPMVEVVLSLWQLVPSGGGRWGQRVHREREGGEGWREVLIGRSRKEAASCSL